MRPKIYAVPIDGEVEIPGKRLSYFYLHGKAEELNGYDICNGDIEAFHYALRMGGFLCEVHFTDKSVAEAVCVCKFEFSRMTGLIVLESDVDRLGDLKEFYCEGKLPYSVPFYTDEEEYLKEKDLWKYFKNS